jgi:hypothetical protein
VLLKLMKVGIIIAGLVCIVAASAQTGAAWPRNLAVQLFRFALLGVSDGRVIFGTADNNVVGAG